jgi:hypothetical protein
LSEIEKGRLDELAEVIDAEHRAFVRTFPQGRGARHPGR